MKRRYIYNFIYWCVRYSGLPIIFREIIQRKKVTILYFHEIHPETADKTFRYLLRKYNIISLNEFFNLHREKRTPPKKALIITFDDGRISNYKLLPIIKKYNIPVTIFLCAGIINTNRHFWWTKQHPNYKGKTLKKLQNNEKLKILKEIGFDQEKNYTSPQALSKEQIHEMMHFVNFQSHTMFHPCLTECSYHEAYDEISKSKKILENEYNLSINAIAYPNGDYSDRDIQLCIATGYEYGLTTDFGFNTNSTDPYRLKRLSVNDTDNINELIVRTSGAWGFIKKGVIFKIYNILDAH